MTSNERVKFLRTSLELTADKFGKRLGVSRAAICNIENGNRKLTEQMIKSICREFQVNELWLRDGIEPIKKYSNEDELEKFFEKIKKENSFRVEIIRGLSKLGSNEWEMIEHLHNCLNGCICEKVVNNDEILITDKESVKLDMWERITLKSDFLIFLNEYNITKKQLEIVYDITDRIDMYVNWKKRHLCIDERRSKLNDCK